MHAVRDYAPQRPKTKLPNRGPKRVPENSHPAVPNPIWHRLATRTTPQGSHLQAKLKVGAPGDEYEREADRVADQVMRMSLSATDTPLIQRLCPECEEEVQRQAEEEEEEEEELIQPRRVSGPTLAASPRAEAQIRNLRGGGQPLPEPMRAYFEPRFGQDFSHVRIHADRQAARTAQAVNARAFTVGQDIAFGAGQYTSDTQTGRWLIAHELAHVVQQDRAKNSIKGSVATTIHRMSGESIYRACHYPSFAGQGGVKDGANWWYPHDFVGPLQAGDKRAVPVNIGYKVPKSPDSSYNCMGWALSHAGTKKSWLQGVTRNASHPWPEEELLASKGCKKIKSSQTADHKVRLYEYKNQDQFHIVRQECDGLWSGKTGTAHLWRGITSPENHTTSFYSQPLANLRITDWSCK